MLFLSAVANQYVFVPTSDQILDNILSEVLP